MAPTLRRYFYSMTLGSPGIVAQTAGWLDVTPAGSRQGLRDHVRRRFIDANGLPQNSKITNFVLVPNDLDPAVTYFAQISIAGAQTPDFDHVEMVVRGADSLTAEAVYRQLKQRATAAFGAPSVITDFHLGPNALID